MSNVAIIAVLVALVIIITMMSWNKKVDSYSSAEGCQSQCQNISGSIQRNLCVQKCLGHRVTKYGGQACSNDHDCSSGQSCVNSGFYTGIDGHSIPSLSNGICMDDSDSGTVQWVRDNMGDVHSPTGCVARCMSTGNDVYSCNTACSQVNPNNNVGISSRMERFGAETCIPGQFWNANANQCQPIFQGASSSKYQSTDSRPTLSIPGTTLFSYGVGNSTPKDILSHTKIF